MNTRAADTSANRGLKTRFTGDTPMAGDKKEMALRAGLVALSTKLETGSQRLWFIS